MRLDRFGVVFGFFGGDWRCVQSFGGFGLSRICVMWRSSQYFFTVTPCDAQMVIRILREVRTHLEVRVVLVMLVHNCRNVVCCLTFCQ